jgi:Ser/Thr protein kinase RdoA (MazF antagonist)
VHDTFHTIGSLAAQLHNQSCGWQEPAGFSRHAWDEQGLVGENPLWGRFWELAALTDEQRQLLITIRTQVASDLARYAADESNVSQYSLIHADFVAENLLVDGEKVRLIDFDDAGYGWHLFELATALYFEMEESYYPVARDALIAGYRCHRQLSEQQLSYLPLFLMARGLTYLGWVHTRPETQTAKEMTPMLIGKACQLAREYLKSTGKDRTDNALVF